MHKIRKLLRQAAPKAHVGQSRTRPKAHVGQKFREIFGIRPAEERLTTTQKAPRRFRNTAQRAVFRNTTCTVTRSMSGAPAYGPGDLPEGLRTNLVYVGNDRTLCISWPGMYERTCEFGSLSNRSCCVKCGPHKISRAWGGRGNTHCQPSHKIPHGWGCVGHRGAQGGAFHARIHEALLKRL